MSISSRVLFRAHRAVLLLQRGLEDGQETQQSLTTPVPCGCCFLSVSLSLRAKTNKKHNSSCVDSLWDRPLKGKPKVKPPISRVQNPILLEALSLFATHTHFNPCKTKWHEDIHVECRAFVSGILQIPSSHSCGTPPGFTSNFYMMGNLLESHPSNQTPRRMMCASRALQGSNFSYRPSEVVIWQHVWGLINTPGPQMTMNNFSHLVGTIIFSFVLVAFPNGRFSPMVISCTRPCVIANVFVVFVFVFFGEEALVHLKRLLTRT